MEAGRIVPAARHRWQSRTCDACETFATKHIRDRPRPSATKCFKRTRRRLKPEYSHLTRRELRAKAQGGADLSED
jgi:hypothetical protein